MKPTEQQQAATAARGKVIVSASAGAGKTAVMIRRLADVLCEGASLDEVLAVTFTKKAAAQMKEKLRAELITRLNQASDKKIKEHLRSQLSKINTADISTIHSFCAKLVRTYFYALDGVDSSFEIVADGAELSKLKESALDNLFDKLYGGGKSGEEPDEDFIFVLERLMKKRSDKSVRAVLLEAYDNLRIYADYKGVEKRCEKLFTEEGFAAVCGELSRQLGQRCAEFKRAVEEFRDSFTCASGKEKYVAVLNEMVENLAVASESDIFERPARLAKTAKPRVREENAVPDGKFSLFTEGVKKRYKALYKDISLREEELEAFMESGRLAKAFCRVILKFDAEYAAVKREESKLDYGDLEHFAYRLACAEDCADADVREQITNKYCFVFVDEFQDVNPIQNDLISAVACGDCFTVGDAKQAIYGFRGSRSRFFTEQTERLRGEGASMILPHNFRSSPAVIALVNELFTKIMKKPVCDFDYSAGHEMLSGLPAEGFNAGVAQLIDFEEPQDEASEEVEGVYSVARQQVISRGLCAESVAVVNLVKELLTTDLYDAERGVTRPVQQGDICILTRKKQKKNVSDIERALLAEGYSVDGASETNVCDVAEIRQFLDVLSYLDNGEQDVPLCSALLSPLGGLDENDLCAVRLFGGFGKGAPPFRRCTEKYASQKSDALAQKLENFFATVERLKRLARGIGAAKLIDVLLREGETAAQLAGKNDKLAALRRLQKEAYSPLGELSLHAFLQKLAAADYKVFMPVAPSSDSIKIMTMHSSKGLEFPIVIISDISVGFKGDERSEMPYDDYFGFAPKCYNPQNHTYRGTLLRKLCKERAAAEDLKNEINLFYVACTRARYGLYILNGGEKPFDALNVANAGCYADLFDPNDVKNAVKRRIRSDELQKNDRFVDGKNVLSGLDKDEKLYERICEIFFEKEQSANDLPVKSSATKILKLGGEESEDYVMFSEEDDGCRGGVESGVAYHRYLQLCDFAVKSAEAIAKEIEDFAESGLITQEQKALLNVERLAKILAMPVFSSFEGKKVFREREFLCKLPADDFIALQEGKFSVCPREREESGVIVQGALDLLAVTYLEGKAVRADIIDYKFSAHSGEYLMQRYAPQLALYKKAVCIIYGLPSEAVSTSLVNIRRCEVFNPQI